MSGVKQLSLFNFVQGKSTEWAKGTTDISGASLSHIAAVQGVDLTKPQLH